MCLAQDQFLNDVIIDFYLKYLVIHLPADRQAKVHVFSTFFYNRLTTKPSRLSRYVFKNETFSFAIAIDIYSYCYSYSYRISAHLYLIIKFVKRMF